MEEVNARLREWAGQLVLPSYFPPPAVSDRLVYRPSDACFVAPLTVPSGLVAVTYTPTKEIARSPFEVSSNLFDSFELSASSLVHIMSWLDWWGGSFSDFLGDLPVNRRSLFHRLLLSGSKALASFAKVSVGLYSNLVLVRRDSYRKELQSTVPAEQVSHLRNAALPTDSNVFPPDLVTAALDKKRAAVQDALMTQTLTSSKAPRRPQTKKVSQGPVAGTSRLPPGATASPVVPRGQSGGASSAPPPSSSSRKRKRKQKKDGAPSRAAGRSGGSGKERKRS